MDPPLSLPSLLERRPIPGSPGIFEFDPVTGSAAGCPAFEGLIVLPDFLGPDEAARLLAEIEKTPFVPAQSGKLKQHYGPKINFNKQRLNPTAFAGLPTYLAPLESRLRSSFLAFEGRTAGA